MQQAANKFFQIRPRLVAVAKWIVLLLVLLIVGTYLIRESYEQSQGEALDWLDCWCAVAPWATCHLLRLALVPAELVT